MARRSVRSENQLYDVLISLKRHLGSCAVCRYAMRSHDASMVCSVTTEMILTAAKSYDAIVGLRIAARNSDISTVYPCPKLTAHGKLYELTAVPVVVTGYQDRLF